MGFFTLLLFTELENFLREEIKKPTNNKSSSDQLDFAAKPKSRKLYAIAAERWHLASKIPSESYIKSEKLYWAFEKEEGLEQKIDMLEDCREFLQIHFRTMDIGSHLKNMKNFWKMPNGPVFLSKWFEWVTEGSRDGCLKETAEDNSDKVFSMIAAVLSDMKGDAFKKEFKKVDDDSQARFGNETWSRIFLLRDLSSTWKNLKEKLIFVEGVDDLSKLSKQPFVHVHLVAQTGVAEFDEKMLISLRVGTTIIFDDLSLLGALASLIEVIFVFNLMYPVGADDTFQFIQRILCAFGPSDGARNVQGKVRKQFVDFQRAVGRIMMDSESAAVVKLRI